MHAKGGAHYVYVSPAGERLGNKGDAFAAGGRKPSAPRPLASKPPPNEPNDEPDELKGVKRAPAPAAVGERQSVRSVARRATGVLESYAEVDSDAEGYADCLPAQPAQPIRAPKPHHPTKPQPPVLRREALEPRQQPIAATGGRQAARETMRRLDDDDDSDDDDDDDCDDDDE